MPSRQGSSRHPAKLRGTACNICLRALGPGDVRVIIQGLVHCQTCAYNKEMGR